MEITTCFIAHNRSTSTRRSTAWNCLVTVIAGNELVIPASTSAEGIDFRTKFICTTYILFSPNLHLTKILIPSHKYILAGTDISVPNLVSTPIPQLISNTNKYLKTQEIGQRNSIGEVVRREVYKLFH